MKCNFCEKPIPRLQIQTALRGIIEDLEEVKEGFSRWEYGNAYVQKLNNKLNGSIQQLQKL